MSTGRYGGRMYAKYLESILAEEAAKTDLSWRRSDDIHVRFEALRGCALLPRGRVKRATKEHTALFEAWTAGKTAEVTRLTHAHIETTREDLARLLQSPK